MFKSSAFLIYTCYLLHLYCYDLQTINVNKQDNSKISTLKYCNETSGLLLMGIIMAFTAKTVQLLAAMKVNMHEELLQIF